MTKRERKKKEKADIQLFRKKFRKNKLLTKNFGGVMVDSEKDPRAKRFKGLFCCSKSARKGAKQ